MKTLKPFADNSASQSIGDLTVENGTDKIAVYGSLDLTRDKAGLERARMLKAVLDAAVQALEREHELPDQVAAAEPTVAVKNPFA
jgi:hypothetical protein